MITIAVYHKTVPSKKNQEKVDILNFFADGARVVGDVVTDIRTHDYIGTDVAIIQGWVASKQVATPHGNLRNQVICQQRNREKYTVGVDSNLFLYANTANPLHYLRYSFNGVFPATGNYCDSTVIPDRWQKISKDLGISLRPYRKLGGHILLCLQRTGGWSMGAIDSQDWAVQTITEIKKHSDRPIVVRLHPGDKQTKSIIKANGPMCKIKFSHNVILSHNETLVDDLQDCWAVVNHNSSPVVGAAIEGYPIFVTDPDNSQCAQIANLDIAQIEQPCMPDRQHWVERLSMFHWKFDELKSGECWQHMRQFIINDQNAVGTTE